MQQLPHLEQLLLEAIANGSVRRCRGPKALADRRGGGAHPLGRARARGAFEGLTRLTRASHPPRREEDIASLLQCTLLYHQQPWDLVSRAAHAVLRELGIKARDAAASGGRCEWGPGTARPQASCRSGLRPPSTHPPTATLQKKLLTWDRKAGEWGVSAKGRAAYDSALPLPEAMRLYDFLAEAAVKGERCLAARSCLREHAHTFPLTSRHTPTHTHRLHAGPAPGAAVPLPAGPPLSRGQLERVG